MNVHDAARIVWAYHRLGHQLVRSDCILVLGSNDTRVAARGAELYIDGWAPLVVLSGGLGNFTRGAWERPEAEVFLDLVLDAGVPREHVLIENQSTNSGENIQFTRELLERQGIHPSTFILVQKPFMERRAFATFHVAWPGKDAIVTSPPVSFEAYPNELITMDALINTMVGDLQRILVYPSLGFQVEQVVPRPVLDAYEFLIENGYTKHLLPT